MDITIDYALEQDRRDPLVTYRQQFVFPEPDLIYMDGNSLGRLPANSIDLADDLVKRQWGERLIRSWDDGWWTKPLEVGAKIAQLIGARPDEVVVSDSTSINLFKLVVAALRSQENRRTIFTDNLNFPSDLYILQGIVELLDHKHQISMVPSADGIYGPAEAIQARLDEDSVLLSLTHTVFKSSYTYDMAAMTAAALEAGVIAFLSKSEAPDRLQAIIQACSEWQNASHSN